jgi:hypothetical protein
MRLLATTLGAALASTLLAAAPARSPDMHHAASGRYRLVVTGFTVNHETWDNAFETDGKRDEIWIDARIQLVDRAGQTISQIGGKRTSVIGDVNGQSGRIQGGSASTRGGLRTGDAFPTPEPWNLYGGVSTTGGLPMEVWRGDLLQGGNGVAVLPSVWEWDGPQDAVRQFGSFVAGMGSVGPGIVGTVFAQVGRFLIDGAPVGARLVDAMYGDWLGRAEDRPLGLGVVRTTADGKALYGWKATPMISLTYESAEALLAANPTGRGLGVASIRYVDDTKFAGDYTLYLKIERVQ